jgi:hypothetical protein
MLRAMSELKAIDANLWICDQPLRYLGFAVGARMTLVRLSSGEVLAISPVRLTESLRAEVDAIGPVRQLVAPNRYHHLFVGDWMAAYPEAQAHAAPGLQKKRKDVSFHSTLGDEAPAAWARDLDQIAWRGSPQLNEIVFRHKPTRTLIVTDAVHNVGPDRPFSGKLFMMMLGGYGGLKSNLIDRIIARDKAAVRETVRRILMWDFDRVIMAHGAVLDGGGHEAFRSAYAWLGNLTSPPA